MRSTTYYDTFPEAVKALEAAVLLHLSIEFCNELHPELGVGVQGLPEGVTTGGLYRYRLTVSTDEPPTAPGWNDVRIPLSDQR